MTGRRASPRACCAPSYSIPLRSLVFLPRSTPALPRRGGPRAGRGGGTAGRVPGSHWQVGGCQEEGTAGAVGLAAFPSPPHRTPPGSLRSTRGVSAGVPRVFCGERALPRTAPHSALRRNLPFTAQRTAAPRPSPSSAPFPRAPPVPRPLVCRAEPRGHPDHPRTGCFLDVQARCALALFPFLSLSMHLSAGGAPSRGERAASGLGRGVEMWQNPVIASEIVRIFECLC